MSKNYNQLTKRIQKNSHKGNLPKIEFKYENRHWCQGLQRIFGESNLVLGPPLPSHMEMNLHPHAFLMLQNEKLQLKKEVLTDLFMFNSQKAKSNNKSKANI